MLSKRRKILDLCDQGLIKPNDIQEAMEVAGVFPDRQKWYNFIEIFLLWLGVIALTAGIVLFVAYNWNDMGRMAKFTLVEGLLIVSLLPLLKFDTETLIGKITMFGAGIILGALLALFGQIYQTGADTWQLFATWAAMLLPLGWMARFEPLWIVWIVIVNIAVILYFSLFDFFFYSSTIYLGLALISLNTLLLATWEYIQSLNHHRMYVRFPAVFAVASATLLGFGSIIDFRGDNEVWLILWLLWIIVYCWIYRQKIKDLFMLTLGCLSAIIVMVTFMSKHFVGNGFEGGSLFLIAISIIIAGFLSGLWLKNTVEQWEAEVES